MSEPGSREQHRVTPIQLDILRKTTEADVRFGHRVTGFTQDQAAAALRDAGLTVATTTHPETSTEVKLNSVTRTEPAAGSAAKMGDAVSLYVSNGMVDLGDLSGQTQEQAEQTLRDLGLSAVISTEEVEGATAGTVTSQSPVAGPVAQGSSVRVVVAAEIPMAVVPQVVGLTLDEARTALGEAGFQASLAPGSNGNPTTLVVSSNPAPDTEVRAGSTVELTFAPEPSPSPSGRMCEVIMKRCFCSMSSTT